jgi:hypothetical protein
MNRSDTRPMLSPSRRHERARGLSVRVAALLVLPLVPGCYSAPRRASEILADPPPKAESVSAVPARVDESVVPAGYWKHDGQLEPAVALEKCRRVVVTEFDVELVDLQFQPALQRQPMIKVMPIPILVPPFTFAMIPGAAIQVIGLGRKNTHMAEEQQEALASELYTAFTKELRKRKLEPVADSDLLASPTYRKLRKKPFIKSSPLMVFNPLGSDIGRVMHTRTFAAPGLGVVQGTTWSREAAELRILQETHADVAMAVKLRVGTFLRKPALEHRSTIRLTTLDGSTTLRARHSLVSDVDAAETLRFRPIAGRSEPIEFEVFSRELTTMLPKFVTLALEAPES